LLEYARGDIRTVQDLIATASLIRPLLGVSPSAWEEACAAMGEGQASVALAAILQRGTAIKNAGGYLRTLTRRASAGEFSVWPMLIALTAPRRRREAERVECTSQPSLSG
jgi:replication initiation protein RepC